MKKWPASADFSRIPWSVLSDKRLKPLDLRIYAVLSAYERNGGIIRTGERMLADSAGFSRRYFRTLVQRLIVRKHVEIMAGGGAGSRRAYRLTDPMFARHEADKKKRGRGDGLECGVCRKPMRIAICDECLPFQKIAEAM